ncbi:MAG: DMT family transporter [bacterium]|nr:DMT family transporter [bacterium]
MLAVLLALGARILSNSFLNVFQKKLTILGEAPPVINLYTYFGLILISLMSCSNPLCPVEVIPNAIIMGCLGALGNYYIIKALSCGELSLLAPINSYKPVVALIFGYFILKEIPSVIELIGIFLIIAGTVVLVNKRLVFNKAYLYRFLALIFSGTEAIFIKKVILLTDIKSAFFYWSLAGLIFAMIIAFKHKRIKISKSNIPFQIFLVLFVACMQYSTNYVFSKINVAYALSLFQLSVILSVFLGVNIFNEKDLIRKILASLIMILGATILIF